MPKYEPSDHVCDTFRERNGGKVDIPVNSKPANDNYHLDQSRLGMHEEWDGTVKNDWGGTGKFVPVRNDVRRNAIAAMGDLRARSSNTVIDAPSNDTKTGPCCPSVTYPSEAMNPMYRKRRGE